MSAPSARPRYLLDQSVMSHYWSNPVVRAQIDQLAGIGILCSTMITMDGVADIRDALWTTGAGTLKQPTF